MTDRRIDCAAMMAVVVALACGCSRSARPAPASTEPAIAATDHAAMAPAPTPAAAPAPPRQGAIGDAGMTTGDAPGPACGEAGDVLVFVSPARPARGQVLTAIAVTDHEVDAHLTLAAGAARAEVRDRQGGPPYFWVAQIDAPVAVGAYRAELVRDDACGGGSLGAASGKVSPVEPTPPKALRTSLWATRRAWSRSTENLYSAWVQRLFDAPADVQPSWPALHEVLRDRSRNFLFDHLGAGEDEMGMVVRPDCADLPYFLRAYFADKLQLPFAWSRCGRGENGAPPRCVDFATSEDPFPTPDGGPPPPLPAWADPDRVDAGPWENNAKRLGEFFRTTLADAARSGAGRTPVDEEDSDFYPIALSTESLRPGTIFGDPYGHVLVVAKRLPQTATSAGVLFAVDGQPDGTVARKRFWRGNFLFAIDPALGAAGFKRFRPVAREGRDLVRPKNEALADYSPTDQYAGGVEGFYDKMDDVLSPAPIDPTQALLETLQALEEQVRTRVVSVENGRKYLAGPHATAEMPEGETIFETTGDWEDYSTPSRDMRILIAIDVATGMPARVARRPERYAMPPGAKVEAVRAELEARLARELHDRKVTYTRSDGSPWELSLADVVSRQQAFEVAYNPNDCVELRWGAPSGSPEASTCVAHAPPEQSAKMIAVRSWFHDRKRPAH